MWFPAQLSQQLETCPSPGCNGFTELLKTFKQSLLKIKYNLRQVKEAIRERFSCYGRVLDETFINIAWKQQWSKKRPEMLVPRKLMKVLTLQKLIVFIYCFFYLVFTRGHAFIDWLSIPVL